MQSLTMSDQKSPTMSDQKSPLVGPPWLSINFRHLTRIEAPSYIVQSILRTIASYLKISTRNSLEETFLSDIRMSV